MKNLIFSSALLLSSLSAFAQAPVAAGADCPRDLVISTRNALDATRGPFMRGLISMVEVDRARLAHLQAIHCHQKNASPRLFWSDCAEMLKVQGDILQRMRAEIDGGGSIYSEGDFQKESVEAAALESYCRASGN